MNCEQENEQRDNDNKSLTGGSSVFSSTPLDLALIKPESVRIHGSNSPPKTILKNRRFAPIPVIIVINSYRELRVNCALSFHFSDDNDYQRIAASSAMVNYFQLFSLSGKHFPCKILFGPHQGSKNIFGELEIC